MKRHDAASPRPASLRDRRRADATTTPSADPLDRIDVRISRSRVSSSRRRTARRGDRRITASGSDRDPADDWNCGRAPASAGQGPPSQLHRRQHPGGPRLPHPADPPQLVEPQSQQSVPRLPPSRNTSCATSRRLAPCATADHQRHQFAVAERRHSRAGQLLARTIHIGDDPSQSTSVACRILRAHVACGRARHLVVARWRLRRTAQQGDAPGARRHRRRQGRRRGRCTPPTS